MIYRAAAALPSDDREHATAALRGQLRIMAVAGGTTPDWSTLEVEGPDPSTDPLGQTSYEWAATVAVADLLRAWE